MHSNFELMFLMNFNLSLHIYISVISPNMFFFFFILESLFSFFYFSFSFFFLFRASLVACGSSQARGRIRATTAGIHHSYSKARFEPYLWPTPQLTAKPDPRTTDQGQGSNLHPHGYQSDYFCCSTRRNPRIYIFFWG